MKKIRSGLIIALLISLAILILRDVHSEDVKRIFIEPSVKEELTDLYVQNKYSFTEFSVCLKGTITDNDAKITSYYFQRQSRAALSVEYTRCSGYGVIGSLHSHPENDCTFSDQDIFDFGKSKSAINGIMCGDDNFIFINSNLEYLKNTNGG